MKNFREVLLKLLAVASITSAELIIAVPNTAYKEQQQFVVATPKPLPVIYQQLQQYQAPNQQQQQYQTRNQPHQQQFQMQNQQNQQYQAQTQQQQQPYPLVSQKQREYAAQQQKHLLPEELESAASWDMASFLPSPMSSLLNQGANFNTKQDSDGAISITIKLEPKQLLALQDQQLQQKLQQQQLLLQQQRQQQQQQQVQQQFKQRLQSQSSQQQNTIVDAPRPNPDDSFDSQISFWKELKGLVGSMTNLLSKSPEKSHNAARAVGSVQPQQLATYFQSVGQLTREQQQKLQALNFQINPRHPPNPQQQKQNSLPAMYNYMTSGSTTTTAAPTTNDEKPMVCTTS
jgi:hypothetical protein